VKEAYFLKEDDLTIEVVVGAQEWLVEDGGISND
jgi:hypothetical protein